MNAAPRYRLALVRVDPRGPEHDEVRYLENPFAGYDTRWLRRDRHPRRLGQDVGEGRGAVLS